MKTIILNESDFKSKTFGHHIDVWEEIVLEQLPPSARKRAEEDESIELIIPDKPL